MTCDGWHRRRGKGSTDLRKSEPLALLLDFMNPYDLHAVAVRTCDVRGRVLIGYVPRYLTRDIYELCLRCEGDFIKLTVEQVNCDAPLEHSVLCRTNACWPEGFQPCSGDEFQPLFQACDSTAGEDPL